MNNKDFVPESSETEKRGALTVKRNKTADFIAKLLCLVAAFVIWFFAAQNDTAVFEEVFSSVPVEIVNTGKLSVLSGDGATVDITLSGKRSVINKLSSSDIRAYVDMSAVNEAGKHTFEVQYDVPNGTAFVKSTSNSITLYVDNATTVTVPVRTRIANVMVDNGYELGMADITTDVRNVTVTGPESLITQIEYAELFVDMNSRLLTSTVSYNGSITLRDKNGEEITSNYIKTSVSHVTATIPVYKYRDVPIEISYKYGYFNENNCTVTASPASIRIKGEASAVDSVKIEYVIDEKTITGDTTYTKSISLPSDVKMVEGKDSVDISITLKGVKSKTFNVYSIEYENPKNLKFEEVIPPIENVVVRGDIELINQLSWSDITAVAELGSQPDVNGNVAVPVSFKFTSQFDGLVYVVGTYTVSVKINP